MGSGFRRNDGGGAGARVRPLETGEETAGASLPRAPGAGRLGLLSSLLESVQTLCRRAAGSRCLAFARLWWHRRRPLWGAVPPFGALGRPSRFLPSGVAGPDLEETFGPKPSILSSRPKPGRRLFTLCAASGPHGGQSLSRLFGVTRAQTFPDDFAPAAGFEANPRPDSRPRRLIGTTRAGFRYGIGVRTSQEHLCAGLYGVSGRREAAGAAAFRFQRNDAKTQRCPGETYDLRASSKSGVAQLIFDVWKLATPL